MVFTRRDALLLAGLALVTVAACALLFWNSVVNLTCCDTVVYAMDAAHVQKHGFTRDIPTEGFRTYGYAAFLALIYAGYEWTPAFGLDAARHAVVQTILYLAACLALFLAIYPRSRTFAWCAAIGLMANPFVLNYVPLRLTEGLTSSLAIAVAACAVWAAEKPPAWRLALALFIGSLLAAFAMMVRPSNLSIFVAWVAVLGVVAWREPGRRATVFAAGLAGLLIPLLPQFYINYTVYDRISAFPTGGLAKLQTTLGLLNYKFGAFLTEGGFPSSVFYRSSLFSETEAHQYGIGLYFTSPLKGAILAAAHMFQSVNHDFFFTYNYSTNPWASAPANLLGHATLFLAASAAVRSFRWHPAALFAFLTVFMTFAVNAIVTVETRFGMLVYVAAGPLAVWAVATLWRSPRHNVVAAATPLYATVATALSFAMLP